MAQEVDTTLLRHFHMPYSLVRKNITDYFTLQLSFNGTEHTFSLELMRCNYEENKNQTRRYWASNPGKLLYEKRNELILEGCYTDAIDKSILKVIDAKECLHGEYCNALNVNITVRPFFGDSNCETVLDQLY